jgi:16S rRNA (uracil1498-N3)-methyltransferase
VAVETLTEVGVDVVVPWAAERCVTQWRGERADRSLERWRTTAREAAKQSRRAWFPEVPGLASTADVVERLRTAALAVVLHESATEALATVDVPSAGDVVLVVGPEGGLSDAEVAAFGDVGAVAYRLGPTVLRTSTAGTAAAALLLGRTPRWR